MRGQLSDSFGPLAPIPTVLQQLVPIHMSSIAVLYGEFYLRYGSDLAFKFFRKSILLDEMEFRGMIITFIGRMFGCDQNFCARRQDAGPVWCKAFDRNYVGIPLTASIYHVTE